MELGRDGLDKGPEGGFLVIFQVGQNLFVHVGVNNKVKKRKESRERRQSKIKHERHAKTNNYQQVNFGLFYFVYFFVLFFDSIFGMPP